MKSNVKEKKLLPIIFLLVAAILIASLNILMSLLPNRYTRLDLSSEKLFTLSSKTKDYLSSLDEDVTLYVIGADGTNRELEVFINRFSQYGDRVKIKNVGNADVDLFLEERGFGEDVTVSSYSVMVESAKRSRLVDYNEMYYYQNDYFGEMSPSTYSYYYNYLYSYAAADPSSQSAQMFYYLASYSSLYFRGEKTIAGAIEYTLLDLVPHVYYLTGHGEADMSSSKLGTLFTAYGEEYEALKLDGKSGVPEDADCLIINSPVTDYSEDELEKINAYLGRGGRITLITSPDNLGMPNLMSLVNRYGLSAGDGIITVGSGEDTETVFTPEVNADHDALYDAASLGVQIANANPIIIPETTEGSVIITPLLTSADDAFIEGDEENKGEFVSAVAIEEMTDSGKAAQTVWFTGADSFSDGNFEGGGAYLVYSAVSWMSESYTSLFDSVQDKTYNSELLTVSSGAKNFWGIVLVGLIPLGVAGAGIYIYVRRKKA
ncbi:MAG: Gldg family protein [Eubacteriales bacterium]